MSRLPRLPGWATSTVGVAHSQTGRQAALARVVATAVRHVPLYRRHWGLTPADDPDAVVRRFGELPLLRKADLLAAGPTELLDRRFAGADLATEPTSGSSGQAFTMRIDASAHRARRMRFLTALLANGYFPGRRILVVSSQPTAMIESRQRWASRLGWQYVDLDSPESAIAASFARTRPHVVYGPLSALLDLAARLPAAATRYLPRRVISTGEQLLPQQRRILQDAFGTDVTDFYGMTELGLLAYRPAGMEDYRVARRDFLLEFLPLAEGGDDLERLVVTDLRGGALPLLRFDTGDLVRRDLTRPEHPITAFLGRRIDSLVLTDGTRLSPYRLITTLEALAGVAEYRVTQQADRSVEVTLRCGGDDGPALAARAQQAVTWLCPGLPLRVSCTPDPLPRPDGKLRPIRSLASGAA